MGITRLFDDPLHLVILLVVILIVFGAGKLPGVGSALGQSIREFKKATTDPDEAKQEKACPQCHASNTADAQFCISCGASLAPQVSSGQTQTIFCPQCGAKNPANGRFCAQCGTSLNVHAS